MTIVKIIKMLPGVCPSTVKHSPSLREYRHTRYHLNIQ